VGTVREARASSALAAGRVTTAAGTASTVLGVRLPLSSG